MTNIVTTATSKAIVAFVAAAMIFTMFATPAKAQTVEELQAQINALMAQIAALSGGTAAAPAAAACGPWTRDLRTGMTGADVRQLQQYLNRNADTRVAATGAGSAGMETEFYGPATAAAVSKFQVMHMAEILTPNGLTSPTGFFGPSTRAKMNALCAAAPTTPTTPTTPGEDGETTPTTPALQGGEGSATVRSLTSGAVDIDFGRAEKALEMEVEAKDSDIAINRVDFIFNNRPWLYFKEVNLLVDGREVASLTRSSDFTERATNQWRARFSGLNLVVREGQTVDVALELVALDSVAASRITGTPDITVTFELDGIRFVDGAGISETAGLNASNVANVDINDSTGDGRVQVTVADASPRAATVVINESSRTNGVTIGNFDVRARDDDMTVRGVKVNLNVGNVDHSPEEVFHRARLMQGNTVLRQVAVSGATSTTEIFFDDLNVRINKDATQQFRVEVDFNRGDQITPNNGTFQIMNFRVYSENSQFNTPTTNPVVLNVGEVHNFLQDGVVLKAESKTTSLIPATNVSSSTGEFRIRYEVKAVGETVWVPLTAVRNASTAVGAAYRIEDSNGAPVAALGTADQSLTRVSGGSVANGFVRINDGETAVFELYVTYRPAAPGIFRAQLLTVGFNDEEDDTPNRTQDALPAEDFETNNQTI